MGHGFFLLRRSKRTRGPNRTNDRFELELPGGSLDSWWPRLQRIGQSVGDCVETTESSLGPIHEAFTIAQATDTAIPADELELHRDELRVQRQWLGEDLGALQRIYPELSNRDKQLARDLRRALRQLDHIELSPFGLHWPDLDEDLSIRGILSGDYGQKPHRAA